MDSQQNDKAPGRATEASNEPGGFVETRWSLVLSAGEETSLPAMRAREELCAAYWPPIYTFIRRRGHSPQDSEDLTQQFFVHILGGSNLFSRADRALGRFRSYLLGSLKHFLINEARKASTLKRGGGVSITRYDFDSAEKGYLQVPDPDLTPEQVYDRHWAETLLDLAFQRLRDEFKAAEQLDRFEVLKSFLSEKAESGDYQKSAGQLGMTSRSVGVAVCRLRQRYRQLIQMVVADTLSEPGDIDEEIGDLFG